MRNRVYGILGIGVKMANWNAGFDGRPKQTMDGTIYGSDKSLKYSIRNLWKDNGETVLYFKQYGTKKVDKKDKAEIISALTLKEVFEKTFDVPLNAKKTSMKQVLSSLFTALDVKNFGATFAVEGFNGSITGAVQIGQGINIYEDSMVEIQDILSPFTSSEENSQSSVGKQIMLNEGHYAYPFSINPTNYDKYEELLGIENPYTKEAFEKFKKASLQGATYLNSCSKAGCYNEYGLFIELKEGSEKLLEPMHNMVVFTKENGKPTYDFTAISNRLKEMEDQIEKVVLYCNPYQANFKGTDFIEVKNIFTDL